MADNPLAKKHQARGFTLVELLIAISIFSIMAVIASTVLFTVFNARDKTTQHAVALSDLQIAFVLIEKDFMQIVNKPLLTATKLQNPIEGLENSISFSRGGMINPLYKKQRSTLSRVSYQLQSSKLLRNNIPALDSRQPIPTKPEVVLKEVTDLQFEYIDQNNAPQSQWLTTSLPKAIRITIEHKQWGKLSQIYQISQSYHEKLN